MTEENPTSKNLGGRPTDFKPEYCQQLIEHMEEGYSFESFAGRVKKSRATIYNWLDAQPEFLDAKNTAFECSRFFWENIGINISRLGEGNATAYIFNMKNRFPDEWREKQTEVNINSEKDSSVSVTFNEKTDR